jgi:hypothetical protein
MVAEALSEDPSLSLNAAVKRIAVGSPFVFGRVVSTDAVWTVEGPIESKPTAWG